MTACLVVLTAARPDEYVEGYQRHAAPIVQKHIYVHVPPPDHEYRPPRQRVIAPPPPKKHYKIVFIKAPTAPAPLAPEIPALQGNEEKTLIYVLHKNPSDSPPIVIPTPKATPPSKPEVFFIRYKTQKATEGGGGASHFPSSTRGPSYSTLRPSYADGGGDSDEDGEYENDHSPSPSTVNIHPRTPTPHSYTISSSPSSLR